MDEGPTKPGGQGDAPGEALDAPWEPLIETAARSLAPTAAGLWDRALDLMPADHPGRALLHANRARTAWACGEHATAIDHARRALELTDQPDVVTRARATLALATMARQDGLEAPEAVDLEHLLTAHTAGSSTPEDDIALAIALADRAITEIIGGQTRQGTRTAAAVLRLMGTEHTTSRAAIPARMALAVSALYDGRISDAQAIAAQFMAQVNDDPDSDWIVAYSPWAIDGLVWTAAGEHKQARRTIAAGRLRARAAELPVVDAVLNPVEALSHLSAGRWDDAIAVADGHLSQADATQSEMYRPWMLAVKAIIDARRGDPAAARASLEQLGDQPPHLHGGGHLTRWADATIARAEGRFDDTRAVLRALDAEVTAAGSRVGWMPIALDHIHQEFEVGAAARARCRALISRLAPTPGASITVESMWHGVHCLATGDLGGLSDAANALASPFPFESARFYVAGMIVAHWHGRTASAVQLAGRAHVAFGQLGATVEQRRLQDLLAERDLELPATEETPIGLEGLTERETEIAALVCAGHSNAEVAAAVGMAIPKVEAMLHDIYAKAGVNDRLRLAALVAAHSPPWARSREP